MFSAYSISIKSYGNLYYTTKSLPHYFQIYEENFAIAKSKINEGIDLGVKNKVTIRLMLIQAEDIAEIFLLPYFLSHPKSVFTFFPQLVFIIVFTIPSQTHTHFPYYSSSHTQANNLSGANCQPFLKCNHYATY